MTLICKMLFCMSYDVMYVSLVYVKMGLCRLSGSWVGIYAIVKIWNASLDRDLSTYLLSMYHKSQRSCILIPMSRRRLNATLGRSPSLLFSLKLDLPTYVDGCSFSPHKNHPIY